MSTKMATMLVAYASYFFLFTSIFLLVFPSCSNASLDDTSRFLQRGGAGNTHLRARDLQYVTDEDRADPIQAAKDVQAIPFVANNNTAVLDWQSQLVQGDSDEAQLPWNSAVPFVQTPNTNITPAGGWVAMPALDGFDLNRTWQVLPNVTMPFYSLSGLDPANVKRALISWPGKPRDVWKYANLYRNALAVVEANQSTGVAPGSVLIISPVWLNQLDQQGGAALPTDLIFHGSQWQAGGTSRSPTLPSKMTTYDVMDNFTDMLFNKALFPALNQVVIAGHSMGGQASHRYAILKKQKKYDDNMSYWMGNPGSWTYLSSNRPYNNASCTTTFDNWHYGLGGNLTKVTKYARKDVYANKTAVVQRYLNRKVHMALGLLDIGPGDTHCEARDQGASHLDRGSQYVLHLAEVNNGTFPAAHTVDFIGNISHQDFAMMSSNESLNWLFINEYNVRYPDINASNPGDTFKYHPSKGPKRSYATHGNVLLATSLLSGSLAVVILFFVTLPFLFPPNYEEVESPPKKNNKWSPSKKKEAAAFAWQSKYLDTLAIQDSPVVSSQDRFTPPYEDKW